jgi:hypothetical protein
MAFARRALGQSTYAAAWARLLPGASGHASALDGWRVGFA